MVKMRRFVGHYHLFFLWSLVALGWVGIFFSFVLSWYRVYATWWDLFLWSWWTISSSWENTQSSWVDQTGWWVAWSSDGWSFSWEISWGMIDFTWWVITGDWSLWDTIWVVTTGVDWFTGWSSTGIVSTGINYGDIQIVEIFPSSGGCLDEYIIIRSSITYAGRIDLWWLGTSTGTVSVSVDMEPWESILITDNLAGMVPSYTTILVSSVTLTNGWERLQLMISWNTIDDLVYSNLQFIRSLFFTSLSGTQRVFSTNGLPTPPTTCTPWPPLVGVVPWWVGLCDISLWSVQYQSTWVYTLMALVTGSLVQLCQTSWLIEWWSWSINGFSQDVWHCQTRLTTQKGINTIEFSLVSWSQVVCYDQFIFANQYDVYTVFQQWSSPWWSVCQTTTSSSSQSTRPLIVYPSTDCGLQLQWTYPLWLFITNSFNLIASYKDGTLSDSQSQFDCLIEFSDGTTLNECNPSSYRFTKPWVHKVSLSIYTHIDRQLVCTTRTFINVPINKLWVNLLARSGELFTWFDTINTWIELSSQKTNTDETVDKWPSFDEWKFDCTDIDQTPLPFTLDMILPNPVWSDALLEEIIFKVTNKDAAIPSISLSDYHIIISKKKHILSWILTNNAPLSQKKGRSLTNNGGCLTVWHRFCDQSQYFCYDKVKEWEWIYFDDSKSYLLSGVITQTGSIQRFLWSWLSLSDKMLDKKATNDGEKSPTLSCTEKISLAKKKQKLSFDKKYEKLKQSFEKYKYTAKQQIDWLKTKELLARNKWYLYENLSKEINRVVTTSRWSIAQEIWLSWYLKRAEYLESQITSWYIYTNKQKRQWSGSSYTTYTYVNDIKKDIKQQTEDTLIDTLIPDISQYIDELYRYQINYPLIKKIQKTPQK